MIKIIRYNVLKLVKPKTDWKTLAVELNKLKKVGLEAAKARISLNDVLLSLQILTN